MTGTRLPGARPDDDARRRPTARHLLSSARLDVARAEPPDGHWLRRWSASGRRSPGRLRRAVQLAGRRASRRSSSIRRRAADVAESCSRGRRRSTPSLWSPGAGRRHRRTARRPRRTRRSPTITPFGLTGPWADRAATEFTLQALSGGARRCAARGRGRRCRPAASTASTWSACSLRWRRMIGLRRDGRHRRGRGLDLSALEARDHDPAVQPASRWRRWSAACGRAGQGDGGRRRGVRRTATSGSPSSTGCSTGSTSAP